MASPPSSTQTLCDRLCFKPTVTLNDWWLLKCQENEETRRLAIAGVASALEEVPRRVFYSAPISKTYDVFTLETTDGICVILKGLINKEKTIANGFPDEVAKRFQLGFYAGWEKGVAEFLGRNSNNTGVSGRVSDSGSEGKNSSSPTFEHFPQEESTYFWSIFFRSKSLEGSQKDPMSRCSMKHQNTNLVPSSDDVESIEGESGAIVQSRGKINEPERCSSNSTRKVTRFLSEFLSSIWKSQQMAGNGSSSEKKTTDSIIKVSETVNNLLQNDKCEVQEKGVESPCPTYVHPPIEEEQVSCENLCNADFPIQLSSELSLKRSINDSKFDDLVNHAAVETDKEDFESTSLQCIGTLKAVEENVKNPVPRCSIKHDSTKVGPLNDEGVVASGVTTLFAGEIDTSMISPRNYGGRVCREFSIVTRSKSKTKKIIGNGWNSAQNKMDSVVAGETGNNTSQNVECSVGGRSMFESFLSSCEMTESVRNSSPTSVQLTQEIPNKKVDREVRVPKQTSTNRYSENTIDYPKVDDLMNLAAEVETDIKNIGLTEFQSVGRPETRDGNEKSPAPGPVSEALKSFYEKSKSLRKMDILEGSTSQFAGRVSQLFSGIVGRKWKKQTVGNRLNSETNTTADFCETDDVHVTVGLNKRKSTSLSTLEGKKKRDATSLVNKKREISPASELSKKRKLTSSTLEVNNKKASLSTPKVNTKKRRVSLSLELSKRKPLTCLTQRANSKKEASLSTPEVNTKNRKVSPSTLDVCKKNKSRPTLEVNNKTKVSLSMPEVNTKLSIISPESLSARRSRAGRLQLPPLEFWHNQSPIYDKDHGIIGIQVELRKITPSKGSRSEPRKE